ncbi:hypothetical protein P0Y35_08375 [Kiritimatiellaeota bacterium B1221]|nr:hypothetical protein [Kiritimatiellaeota bacterium B1221]
MRTFFILMLGCGLVGNLLAEDVPLLSPTVHLYGYYGNSSADEPEEFAPGGHDPSRNETFVLQAAEPSVSLRWGDHVQGFVNGIAFTDDEDELDWEWEEYFLKLTDLPAGLEVRGGRMLSRLGFHNATHLHSYITTDAPISHSVFLGDHGIMLEGADLSVYMDTEQATVLTIGFGQTPPHDHDHGDEEEEHEGEDHDDHADHDDHDHDHDHSGYSAYEEYRVKDDVVTIGLRHDHAFNDFKTLRGSLFGGMGDNELGENSWFASAGVEYQWRENGWEAGGKSLRWRTEALRFNGGPVESHDHEEEEHDEDHDAEHEDHDDEHSEGNKVSNWGINSEVEYQMNPHFHPFARFSYIGASDELELAEWFRYTAGITFPLVENPHAFIRFQGNLDERGDESEQSVWAQVGFSWGDGEVR